MQDFPELDDAEERARARAGQAVRDLGHSLVGHHASPELLDDLCAQLEKLVAELDRGELRSRPGDDMQNRHLGPPPADGEVVTSYPDRPVSGAASPWGVDLVVRRTGEWMEGRCILKAAHEGAPARSHGGVVAAIFDDLMGFVLGMHQVVAFTGDLYVRYEAPTPLFTELAFRARLASREGRKLFIEGEAWHGDQRFATARATFIEVPHFG